MTLAALRLSTNEATLPAKKHIATRPSFNQPVLTSREATAMGRITPAARRQSSPTRKAYQKAKNPLMSFIEFPPLPKVLCVLVGLHS